MNEFSFQLYTPLLAQPQDGWKLHELVAQFGAYCKAVESQLPTDSQKANERLQVYATYKEPDWIMTITGEETGDVYGEVALMQTAYKDWPLDLLSARLRLALNGMPETSLEELSAYHELFNISDLD